MSDASRPFPLRKRPDLHISRETFGERSFVVVKDPPALKYYRFAEEEFAQLELFDGRRTLEAMRLELERRFAPRQFPAAGIARFAAQLHQSGLVTSDARGQAAPLLERRRKQSRAAWRQKLLSPMSIQFRGIDPTRLLDRLAPWCGWCYTKFAAAAAALLIAAALLLVALRYDELLRRLPTFEQFFTPANVALLLVLTGAIKIVHELGHALTCRRLGGECHELGVMFLVFAPCLYCNVSDAWRLPKRSRIAIGAAGIVVELVIAAAATIGWCLSGPGLFHNLCLNAMFVSGLSTLVINGNPLMRYDGYFILTDVVETPNLAEKSAAVVRHYLARLFLGPAVEADPLLPRRGAGWFALYAVASFFYRVAVTLGIYLFLLAWLRPYDLEVVARAFGLVSLTGMIGLPLYRRLRSFQTAGLPREADRRRAGLVGAIVAVCAAALLFVPLPQRVWGTLQIEPHRAETVYVEIPGRLQSIAVRPGEQVAAGTTLAVLENLDLELEVAQLAGKASVLRAQLDALHKQRFSDAAATLQIAEVKETLAAVEEALIEKRAELAKLTLTARRAGVVLPPAENATAQKSPPGELKAWSGVPTDARNQGTTFETGTLYCYVGDRHAWEAQVVVDQSDVQWLAVGQQVDVLADALPEVVFRGRVEEIARRELRESPRQLSNKVGGELATVTDAAGVERPAAPTYVVKVTLDDPTAALRIGLRGTARIHVSPASVARRAARWFHRTFHFTL